MVPASTVYVLLPVFVLLSTECIGSRPGLRQPFALALGVAGFRLIRSIIWLLVGEGALEQLERGGRVVRDVLHSRTRLNWLNSFTNLCLDVIILVRMPSSSVAVGEGTVSFCVLGFYAA